jgi:hypothetical protein
MQYQQSIYKAHDNRRNFNLLDRLDVEPVIVIRNNASTRARGCQLRRDEVLLKKLGYEKWKQIKDAGRRWIAEIVFSSALLHNSLTPSYFICRLHLHSNKHVIQ